MQSKQIKSSVKTFLNTLGLYPLESQTWNVYSIKHQREKPATADMASMRKELHSVFHQDSGGIYIYNSSTHGTLYVGKAKRLYDRVYSHYRESFTRVGGDKKGVWHYFFNKYAGDLTIYWIEIGDERERHIIEQCLELTLGTRFDMEFPKGQRFLPAETIFQQV